MVFKVHSFKAIIKMKYSLMILLVVFSFGSLPIIAGTQRTFDPHIQHELEAALRQGRLDKNRLRPLLEEYGLDERKMTGFLHRMESMPDGNAGAWRYELEHWLYRLQGQQYGSKGLQPQAFAGDNGMAAPLAAGSQTVIEQILEDFQVNENVGRCNHFIPAVAKLSNGDIVVVWQDGRNGKYDIYAQLYNSSGNKMGNNFRVNDDSGSSYQHDPAISADVSGNFMVVWRDERNGNPDIYAQRYNSSGNKMGNNFRVNDDSGSSYQSDPAISVDVSGNFVVVWRDERNGNYDIYAQRYNSSGNKMGNNFRVNDDSGISYQSDPAISVDASGNFVVVWEDERNGNTDVYAQLFNSNGQRIRSNYRVNNDTGERIQEYPDVSLVNRHIYYTWQDNRVPGQGWDIFARVDLFNAAPAAPHWIPRKTALFSNRRRF